jgi:hypothetical protein
MVGGGAWRFRIWFEGGWPCFGLGCRGEARCYPKRANNFGATDFGRKGSRCRMQGSITR